MNKLCLVLLLTLNLHSIDFLFKDEVLKCENFIDNRVFCSWGIGKDFNNAKDNFIQNTRIKFDYIFSINKIEINNSTVFQRLSRIEKDLNKFYSCENEKSLKKEWLYFLLKRQCNVIEFKPEEVQISPQEKQKLDRRFELLRTQGWQAFEKDLMNELVKDHKEKMRKEKELEQKLFEEYKRKYYKNKLFYKENNYN